MLGIRTRATPKAEKQLIIVFSDDRSILQSIKFLFYFCLCKIQERIPLTLRQKKESKLIVYFLFLLFIENHGIVPWLKRGLPMSKNIPPMIQ